MTGLDGFVKEATEAASVEIEAAAEDVGYDSIIEITGADLLAIIDEAKGTARAEIEARVRADIEEAIRHEYESHPVYHGVFGFLAWIFGQMPDSRGKPSGSWTLYLLAHVPVIVYVASVAYAIVNGSNVKGITVISPLILLFPMLLAWIAWLAHHKKVAEVVVIIIEAIGKAAAAAKGTATSLPTSLITQTITQATAEVPSKDESLKPGVKVAIKKATTDEKKAPKTDPNSLPETPI